MEEELPKLDPFVAPNFALPTYDNFMKGAPSVFVRDENNKPIPRKPTLDEELRGFAAQNTARPNTQRELDRYSYNESAGFKNPALPYDPNLDMNEVYAKYDPVTWRKSFEKTWDTAAINMWNGMKNLSVGISEGLSNGDVSKLYDNTYAKHLAELTEALEQDKPMYFSDEEQGTASTFMKQLLPTFGYVASSVLEMAGTHVAAAGIGAAIGASGGGAGAAAGAAAAQAGAFIKDAATISNLINKVQGASKALATMSTAGRIKTAAQLAASGLYMANGEAALNAQLAGNRALEEQKREYFKLTGRYLSDSELDAAQEQAQRVAGATFHMNLPLIAASNIFQFTNLVRGKAAPSITEALAFAIDPKTGKAVAKNALAAAGKQYAKEAVSEGLEEFGQSVIEDYAVDYHKNRRYWDGKVQVFAESLVKNATGSGLQDFLGGAIVGGVTNVGTFANVPKVAKQTKEFVDHYNSSTGRYFDYVGNLMRLDDGLRQAVMSGDTKMGRDYFTDALATMVSHHSKMGSTEAFGKSLSALSEMENVEFNKLFGLSMSPSEQQVLAASLKEQYDSFAEIRQQIDEAFKINPYVNDNWFQRRLNKSKSSTPQELRAIQAWDVMKDSLFRDMVSRESLSEQIKDSKARLETQSMRLYDATASERLELRGDGDSTKLVLVESISRFFDPNNVMESTNPESMFNTLAVDVRSANDAFGGGYETLNTLIEDLNETDMTGMQKMFSLLRQVFGGTEEGDRLIERFKETQELVQRSELLSERINGVYGKGLKKRMAFVMDAMDAYGSSDTDAAPSPAPTAAAGSDTTSTPAPTPAPTPTPVAPTEIVPPVREPVTPPGPTVPAIPEPVAAEATPAPSEEDADEYSLSPDDFVAEPEDIVQADQQRTVVEERETVPVAPLAPITIGEPAPQPQERFIDTETDKDVQVNEAGLRKMFEGMLDGSTFFPSSENILLMFGSKKVDSVIKKDGKFFANIDGIDVPLRGNPMDQMTVAPVPTDLEVFIARTKLTGSDLELFKRFIDNNLIALEC